MDEIRSHHFETMGNNCLPQALLGGAGFRPSTVPLQDNTPPRTLLAWLASVRAGRVFLGNEPRCFKKPLCHEETGGLATQDCKAYTVNRHHCRNANAAGNSGNQQAEKYTRSLATLRYRDFATVSSSERKLLAFCVTIRNRQPSAS